MTVFIFRSKSTNIEDNIKDFISFCKNKLVVFSDDFNWDSNYWESKYSFRKLGVKRKKGVPQTIMDDGFLNFAKAYIIYHHALGNKKNLKDELAALKLIEMSLLQMTGKADVSDCNSRIFDNAIRIASENYHRNSVVKFGAALEKLSKFIIDKSFSKDSFFDWVNPNKLTSEMSMENIEDIVSSGGKLSDMKAMEALASIFAKEDHLLSQRDIFTTSIFALLMCAPSRISEILALSADCEYLERDSTGVERYGLRFYSVKGYGADIKWIPTVMIPVAKKAINRLRKISHEARELAKWHECTELVSFKTPTTPDVDNNKLLTVVQVCNALGYEMYEKEFCTQKLKKMKINNNGDKFERNDFHYSLTTLWTKIHENKPDDFPYYDESHLVKYSNALCLLNDNQLHAINKIHKWKLYKPDYNFFIADLKKDMNASKGQKTIFERYGFYEVDNMPMAMHTHQPRHLLNTFARLGGMSDLNIAKWSGRENAIQNKYYNHVSKEHMSFFIKTTKVDKLLPANRSALGEKTNEEFNLNSVLHGAYLLSDKGYCQHNYAIAPCASYPGLHNEERKKIIQDFIDKVIILSRNDSNDNIYGAKRWLNQNLIYLSKNNKEV